MAEIDKSTIEFQIKQILSKNLGVKIENITKESSLIDDLGVDSFGSIELMFEMERKFGLEIPDKDLIKVKTVGDIVIYITSRLKSQNT